MEIIVTLRKKQLLEKILPVVDGVIVGKYFTTGYHLSLDDIKDINRYCKDNSKKIYVVIDNFISEEEKMHLNEYFDFINDLDVDGIYFHDLGIMDIAKSYNMTSKLIYDGKTVLCNSLDTAFILNQGIDSVVLSREITLKEIQDIIHKNAGRVDLQIFGHLRMSYTKRKFLKNYFKQINKEYDYLNKESLYLIEEKRDYKMPIVEDENGTYIYTDYILEMFNEINDLKTYLKRGIIDTLFIEDDSLLIQVCRDYKRITADNKSFIIETLHHNYQYNHSSGYLYQRTNIIKHEQD